MTRGVRRIPGIVIPGAITGLVISLSLGSHFAGAPIELRLTPNWYGVAKWGSLIDAG